MLLIMHTSRGTPAMNRKALLVFGLLSAMIPPMAAGGGPEGMNPDKALNLLIAGNKRYVAGQLHHPHQSANRLHEVAQGQKPYAVILGCADSRVPPELIFDAGLGDLFVIRVAGNIADDAIMGSIEYAVEHLGTALVVVLGHEKCGAVQAAYDGGAASAHIRTLVEHITPVVEKARKGTGDGLDNAVRMNVALVVEELKSSTPVLSGAVAEGKIKIVGARYDLDDGKVEFLH